MDCGVVVVGRRRLFDFLEVVGGRLYYSATIVDQIIDERKKRWGRGYRHQYLVKFTGYQAPEWIDAKNMEDTAALDEWEETQRQRDVARSMLFSVCS